MQRAQSGKVYISGPSEVSLPRDPLLKCQPGLKQIATIKVPASLSPGAKMDFQKIKSRGNRAHTESICCRFRHGQTRDGAGARNLRASYSLPKLSTSTFRKSRLYAWWIALIDTDGGHKDLKFRFAHTFL